MRPFRQRTRTAPGSTRQNRQDHRDQRGGDPADEFVRVAAELDVRDGSGLPEPASGSRTGGRLSALAGSLIDTAPRIPVRDLNTLRAQYPAARTPEDLADRLCTAAARASGAVGAGVGAASMLPVPPAMAVEIAGEMLAVAAVEVKLIAELYQVYGQPAQGPATRRAGAYLVVWSHRRGLDVTRPATMVALTSGNELRRQLRRRLARSGLRKLPTLAPMMIGAAAGAVVNRRDTTRLAQEIRRDLRSRPPSDPGYWA
ncbi:hypothetical protein GXW82_40895 [Streptacidiphilus sp. 4-A2]|nr:hypothetical protein [Streptacidiphilus sp. 4-A2]